MTEIKIIYTGPVVKRSDAMRDGLTYYFTGKPCKRGHISQRYTSAQSCLGCRSEDLKIIADRSRAFYHKNKETINAKRKEKRDIDPKAHYEKYKNWKNENPEEYKRQKRISGAKRYASPSGKMSVFMRKCIYRCANQKTDRSNKILGYTKAELVDHIEIQFQEGMSWENWGNWHIDHIIPIKWFLLAGVNDPKVINKLSNLKPIWAKENMTKGSVGF